MRYVELACGAGGMGLGLHAAGLRCSAAWDTDPIAIQSYRRNVSGNATLADIREMELERDAADVLVAGLPCETFSTIGQMDPSDERGRLWFQFARLLAEMLPKAFLVENVPAFGSTSRCSQLIGRARALGYHCTSEVIDAADLGVPQLRRRLFIAGSLDHAVDLSVDDPTIPRTVRDAIEDLPAEPDGINDHIGYDHTDYSRDRYGHVPPGGDWRDLPRRLMNPCWKRLSDKGTHGILGRLEWDEPADTIRTTFIKPEAGRYIHPAADRGLTLREGARLQGLPDDFYLPATSLDELARLIGRAVPPAMGEHVGRRLAEAS